MGEVSTLNVCADRLFWECVVLSLLWLVVTCIVRIYLPPLPVKNGGKTLVEVSWWHEWSPDNDGRLPFEMRYPALTLTHNVASTLQQPSSWFSRLTQNPMIDSSHSTVKRKVLQFTVTVTQDCHLRLVMLQRCVLRGFSRRYDSSLVCRAIAYGHPVVWWWFKLAKMFTRQSNFPVHGLSVKWNNWFSNRKFFDSLFFLANFNAKLLYYEVP